MAVASSVLSLMSDEKTDFCLESMRREGTGCTSSERGCVAESSRSGAAVPALGAATAGVTLGEVTSMISHDRMLRNGHMYHATMYTKW